ARTLHLGHARGLVPLAALFLVILWAERRAKRATEAYYWLAVIVIRTAATNLSDLGIHDFKLSYALVEPAITALLIAIVSVDVGRDRSAAGVALPDGRAWNLPATDAIYWVTLLIAGILGTASGDFTARILGLGYGSIILAAAYGIVLLASARFGDMSKAWYWASIVAARTAGTTMGDLVARHQGLTFSTVCTGLVLASIVLLWREKRKIRVGET